MADTRDTIVAEYAGLVWRIAGSYEANPDLRRDLNQEILFSVWKALPSFRGDASVKTFIARIAHNICVSHVAKIMRSPREMELQDQFTSDAATPEEAADANRQKEMLAAAIRTLPLEWRQPLSLTLESFTPKEIADVLGVSPNIVSIRLTRAKAALKQKLEHHHA
ncbi:DNA-directed RNA polymerase sigma-70 factor [Kordiimonas sediminis]|uniref:DNA-directed RNA polymerase sigma-70 factor n=1 Tax=Kordiimonas sediminis TaxID=1735581 RepID=A0A919AK97_9PROT|nr:sigma-70 family RNA polymerase sigma factor [Kordiimonas sediminis]GHF13448.1 DNA-directed RNA polymerase sigma-70 factor [Kordiimonas sediminis]